MKFNDSLNSQSQMKKSLQIAGLLFVGVLAYYLGMKNTTFVNMTPYETANAVLRRECDSLQIVVVRLQEERQMQISTIDSLQRSIHQNTVQIHENRKEYENELVRVGNLSDDELFRFFTDYIKE